MLKKESVLQFKNQYTSWMLNGPKTGGLELVTIDKGTIVFYLGQMGADSLFMGSVNQALRSLLHPEFGYIELLIQDDELNGLFVNA